MKIAVITDTHCACRNGSEVIQEYQNRFYSDIFFPYLAKHDIKHILHGGDFFDNRKFLSIKSLHMNRKAFLEPLRDNGIHMDIILGNHDVHYRTTNDVNSLKEVFGFFVNSIDIIQRPTVLQYGSMRIGALPWIAPDNEKESIEFLKTVQCDVLLSHLELAGFEMMKGMPVAAHGMGKELLSRFKMVLSGHYHTKSTQDNIHYLGTPFELTWADCHDPKYFHILDTETGVLEPVRNPYTIHKKIYYTDVDELPSIEVLDRLDLKNAFVKLFCAKKKDVAHFDNYVRRIQELSPHDFKIIESYEEVIDSDASPEISFDNTRQLIDKYVEISQTDLDKEKLISIFKSLLLEAETVDNS